MSTTPAPAPVSTPAASPGRNSTHTERTLEYLRSLGYTCGIVEKTIPNMNRKQDLFGFLDIIALTPHGVLGVQSTGKDFSGHWLKITRTRAVDAAKWLRTPSTSIMLIGWRKVKTPNGPQWSPRIEMVEYEDLAAGLLMHRRPDLLSP